MHLILNIFLTMYPCEENITENIRKIILSSCMYISVDEDWKMCSSCCWLYLSVFSRQPSESNRSECNTGKSAFISRMSKLCRTQKHLPCRLVMNYKINMMQDYYRICIDIVIFSVRPLLHLKNSKLSAMMIGFCRPVCSVRKSVSLYIHTHFSSIIVLK